MNRYGFTGTQRGSTPAQRSAFVKFINSVSGSLAHGDCIGWDAEAHDIAEAAGMEIFIHPPENPSKRAFKSTTAERIATPRPYLVRNRDIVLSTTILLAAPGERQEQLRSGTWATMRFARKQHHDIIAFYPDGSVKRYNQRL